MCPGLWITAAMLGGTAAGILLAAPTVGASLAVAIALIACGPVVARPARRWLWLAAAASVAMAHGIVARDRVLQSPLAAWGEPDATAPRPGVVVTGTLVEDASVLDSGVRLLIDVRVIEDDRGRHEVGGRIQAYVGGDLAPALAREWTAGRSVRALMTLRRPPVWHNPGGPSERWQILRRPFVLTGSVKSALVVTATPGRWWHEWAAAARAQVRERVAALFADSDDHAGAVLVAILIGDRSWLDDAVEHRLQVAGTYHVLAISGGNVALLTAGIFVVLRVVFRSPRVISVATMLLVAAYGWIVGGDASVTRAVVGAMIYLSIGLTALVPPALHVLAFVGLVLAIADPLAVIDAGAWLSFGATAGIIIGAGRIMAWHERWWPAAGAWGRLRRGVLGLVAATAAAELVLLPVSAALFNRVGIAGLVLNAVAIPAIAVVQVSGLVGVLCVGISTAMAAIAALVTRAAVAVLIGSASLVEVAAWLSWRVPAPAASVTVVFYLAAFGWLAMDGWRRRAAGVIFAAAIAVIVTAPAIEWRAPPAGWLRVTVADVGQGDAILVQLPTGRSLLVDAGGAAGRFDIGERVVTPLLWASGVRRLDWLAVTHADLDHIGGAPSAAAIFQPREIWEGIPAVRDPQRDRLKQAGRPWREVRRQDRISVGAVTLDVLNPPPPDWERQRVRNDDSIVLRLRYGDVEVLLTGDIGADAERTLPLDPPRAAIRVLKVAHHGSRSSSSASLLERFAPNVAVVSAGRGNPFGHPAPDVLARIAATGAQLFRTDQDGGVVIETDGRAVYVRSAGGRAWTMRVWRMPA